MRDPDPDPSEAQMFGVIGLLLALGAGCGLLYALGKWLFG